MNCEFNVTIKSVVGFENPLVNAEFKNSDEPFNHSAAFLSIPLKDGDYRELLLGVIDKMFPKKSAPEEPEKEEVKKPSSPNRRKTK